jgi:sucrose-phosphate synthase
MPDVLISSLGTNIHYARDLTEDDFWAEHIDHLWQPRRVRRVMSQLPGINPQEKFEQSFF